MYSKEIENLSHSAEVKSDLCKASKSRYLVSSMLGSLFVALGIMLIYTIGGIMSHNGVGTYKILMGASFGVALSLVLMAGGDLFTSNAMIMTLGVFKKTVKLKEAAMIWLFSWLGNMLGGIVGALLFVGAGLTSGKSSYIGEFIVENALTKISLPWNQLILRGLLCNILVCLAVWMCYKLKEETAKILMIFWCLFTFITAGFEHSVANMSFLAMGHLIDSATITIGGYFYNVILVSIGNFIGGVVFLAIPYYFITNIKAKKQVKTK